MPPVKRSKARGVEKGDRVYLHAHDSGSGLCDARLRQNRSRSFSGIRVSRPNPSKIVFWIRLPTVITADEGVRGGGYSAQSKR